MICDHKWDWFSTNISIEVEKSYPTPGRTQPSFLGGRAQQITFDLMGFTWILLYIFMELLAFSTKWMLWFWFIINDFREGRKYKKIGDREAFQDQTRTKTKKRHKQAAIIHIKKFKLNYFFYIHVYYYTRVVFNLFSFHIRIVIVLISNHRIVCY